MYVVWWCWRVTHFLQLHSNAMIWMETDLFLGASVRVALCSNISSSRVEMSCTTCFCAQTNSLIDLPSTRCTSRETQPNSVLALPQTRRSM